MSSLSRGDFMGRYAKKHSCSDGFYGKWIKTRGIRFCLFCGFEVGRGKPDSVGLV